MLLRPDGSAAPAAEASDALLLDRLLAEHSIGCLYQPIVELSDRCVVGYEALARGPAGSRLEQPALLFAAAIRGRRVQELDRACRTAALAGARLAGLGAPYTLFVNIEPESAGLALRSRTGPPEAGGYTGPVVMEVTERALTARPAELLAMVQRVRERGWGVAVDDVGADPASLALLPLLRPDVIKLDLSLVQGQPSAQIALIVSAVNAESERSGSVVLAEGIETEEHLAIALSLGATLGQGWLLGRPGPLPAVLPTPRHRITLRAPVGLPQSLSPYELVTARRAPRDATKRLLIEISKHLERRALESGESAVVLSTFQSAGFFTESTRHRYAALTAGAAFVGALGAGLPAAPIPGVRGAHLDPADPLLGEWDIAVVGPHFAATLVARDLGDEGPDAARRFSFVLSHDRELAIGVASELMTRMLPDPGSPDLPELPGPSRVMLGPERHDGRGGLPELAPALLARALAATTMAVAIADVRLPGSPLVYVNAAFELVTGYSSERALGRNCRFLQGPGTDPRDVAAMAQALLAGDPWRARLRNYRADGTAFWNELDLSPVRDASGTLTHYIAMQDDVTARDEAHERVRHLAYHDPVTGLPNRALTLHELERALARGALLRRSTAVLRLEVDLDEVSSRHGREVGERALREVAARLRAATRPTDLLARHEGNGFALVLSDLDPLDAVAVAQRVAGQLRAALAEPLELDVAAPSRHPLRVGLCVGLALAPADGVTADALLESAGTAMQSAGRARRTDPAACW